MSTAKDRLFIRYRDAASSIAEASLKEVAGVSTLDALDPDTAALEQLLQHQARALVKQHDLVCQHGSTNTKTIDDIVVVRLDDLASISMSKFYAFRYDLLPYHWRQIYSDTLILKTHLLLLQANVPSLECLWDSLDLIIEYLDRALITAGGAGHILGSRWIEKTLTLLQEVCDSAEPSRISYKKRKRDETPSRFSRIEPRTRPVLTRECPKYDKWAIDKFEDYMREADKYPRPVVFTNLTKDSWPAFNDRPWNSPDYLLSKTIGGRRLVPVEIGRSYVDEDWGQELIQFREFLRRYVEPSAKTTSPSEKNRVENLTGYLAQHNLFQQVPSLRNDICVPDLCWAEVPGHPTNEAKNKEPVDVPQLNAWFGPAGTITPLHTDAYHNLLCQVVGTKYVRLYPPDAGTVMRPRRAENGIDMSNTSGLDLGILQGWDRPAEHMNEQELHHMKGDLEGLEYWECVLEPGDTLLIPMGWWHYVRSLSISFSVSFWWN